MPAANGTLFNCFRVSRGGVVHGYFASDIKAKNYARWYTQMYTLEPEFVIEPWFIEGEF